MKPTIELGKSSPAKQWVIKRLLLWSQRIPLFRARGGYSGLAGRQEPFDKSEIEFADHANFLSYLRGYDFDATIRSKDVLDFGSGYGGRTVWMAQTAKTVHGIEIRKHCVEESKAFAATRSVDNVSFSLGHETSIDFDAEHFDVVVLRNPLI